MATGKDPLQDYQHPLSIEEFRKLGYEAVDMICDYMTSVQHAKVVPDVQPGYLRPLLPASAPEKPEPWSDIKRDFWGPIMKGVTHWQSPNYFSWFPGNTSMPGVLAEMLIAALNMVGFSWQSSPVSTELEMIMMDWLVKLCGLPDKFLCKSPDSSSSAAAAAGSTSNGNSNGNSSSSSSGKSPGGVIQGTSSEAVLVAMLAARARAMAGRQPEDSLKLVAYGTNQAHSCFQKAVMIVGLQHWRKLPAAGDSEFAVQPQQLAEAVAADLQAGLIPFYFLGTIGTTSSCAVDPIPELADICLQHNIWMHVDAAWAGSAAMLPEQRQWFKGLDKVDSYSFNPHKWMVTPMDCCACYFDDSTFLKEALSLTPTYLRGTGNMFDYKDWQIPLGRRFRALKLWFSLRMYGAEKLQELVRHHIALGEWLAEQVKADSRFELVAPPRFGLTCLRLKGVGCDGNKALLAAVNSAGLAFMVGTDLDGQFTLRVAVGQSTTQLEHVQRVWATIQEQAGKVIAQQAN